MIFGDKHPCVKHLETRSDTCRNHTYVKPELHHDLCENRLAAKRNGFLENRIFPDKTRKVGKRLL